MALTMAPLRREETLWSATQQQRTACWVQQEEGHLRTVLSILVRTMLKQQKKP
jgi:hypothetical protein